MTKKLFFLVLLGFLCMGMAGTSGPGPGTGSTDRLFRAVILDASDNSYEVENVSVDSSTHLPAKTGDAEASIDFGRIDRVLFYYQDQQVLARVKFFDGEEMDFYIKPQTTFVGLTNWGRISLQAENIREIRFR